MSRRDRSRPPKVRSRGQTPSSSLAERPAFDSSPFDPSSGRSAWEELPTESIFRSPPSRNESPIAWLSSPYETTSSSPTLPSDEGACGMWAYPSTSGLGTPRYASPVPSKRSTGRATDGSYDEEEEIRVINEILAGGLLGDPRLPGELRKHHPANRGTLRDASPMTMSAASPLARRAMMNFATASPGSPTACGSSSSSPYSSPPGVGSPGAGPSKRSSGPASKSYDSYDEEEEIRVINEILAGGLLGDPRLPDEVRKHAPVDTSELPPWVPSLGCPRLEDPNNPPPTFHPLLDSRWRTDPNISEEYRTFLDMTASFKYHNDTSPYQGIYEYGKLSEFNVHNLRDVTAFDVSSPSCGVADPDEVFGDPYEALEREVPSNVPEKKRKQKHQYFELKKKLEMFKEFGMDNELAVYEGMLESMQADPWSDDEENVDEWYKAKLGPGGRLKLFEKYCRKPYYIDENGEPHVFVEDPPTPVQISNVDPPTPVQITDVDPPAEAHADDACSSDDSFNTACDDFEFPRGFDPEFGQQMEFPGGSRDNKAFSEFIHSWAPVDITNVQGENSELNRTFIISDPLTAGSDSDPCSDTSDIE